jgi:hypothetical protein
MHEPLVNRGKPTGGTSVSAAVTGSAGGLIEKATVLTLRLEIVTCGDMKMASSFNTWVPRSITGDATLGAGGRITITVGNGDTVARGVVTITARLTCPV